MDHEELELKVAKRSALIYLPISIGAAILFFLAASLTGSYPAVARLGGSGWVGLLSLIVSMPLVIPRVKKHYRGTQEAVPALPSASEASS